MVSETINKPDYLFETSWEVCNKVGGIHTVVATKALNLSNDYGKHHIMIGPDVWMDESKNPEFLEDPILFRVWKKQAASDGLRVRVGRWNVPGNPIAILVDFTPFVAKKDEIFAQMWENFKLDSLSGQWDYVESALFGYAAGKVIESFVKFNLKPHHKVVAQFHEWMTGAGILYLKSKNLSIGTVFTTHATVVGRCLACNNMPLYDSLELYDADEKAKQFNVTAKHSLEKTAAHNADVFTTVSDITAAECRQFIKREVDIITPNGFDNSFVPADDKFDACRESARKKLLEVASQMHGVEYDNNTLLVGIGGRYEYKNKGIDVFLDALGRIKNSQYNGKKVLAFVMIPAWSNGPDKELVQKLSGAGNADYTTNSTHYLVEPEYDAIQGKMRYFGFNAKNDNIGVVFVPSYLNGNDGIFNVKYYDLLIGMDLTVFPSCYEPWGYTPLESLAFRVPTVTTTLAGFGLWVKDYYKAEHPGIEVIDRNDSNYDAIVEGVIARILAVAALGDEERKAYSLNAKEVSNIALWENNVKYYLDAYSSALDKVVERNGAFPQFKESQQMTYNRFKANSPEWRTLLINKDLPTKLKHLDTISKNLWWCWNQDAIELFKMVDTELWQIANGNPIAMLDMVDLKRYKELAADEAFLAKLDSVYKNFSTYMEGKSNPTTPQISYFCMEYGLDTSLKIYSGGLGILAGDYLK